MVTTAPGCGQIVGLQPRRIAEFGIESSGVRGSEITLKFDRLRATRYCARGRVAAELPVFVMVFSLLGWVHLMWPVNPGAKRRSALRRSIPSSPGVWNIKATIHSDVVGIPPVTMRSARFPFIYRDTLTNSYTTTARDVRAYHDDRDPALIGR